MIKQLRPVSFNWLANNQADFGLVAEEVSKVEPLLTTVNEKGEVEGVKYERVGVVLINAVNEQQAQIEAQARQIEEQRTLIKQQSEKADKQQAEDPRFEGPGLFAESDGRWVRCGLND